MEESAASVLLNSAAVASHNKTGETDRTWEREGRKKKKDGLSFCTCITCVLCICVEKRENAVTSKAPQQ